MSKTKYLIRNGYLITSLLVRNGSYGITLALLTTLRAIMKCVSRQNSAAVKDIDIGESDIDPPLV